MENEKTERESVNAAETLSQSGEAGIELNESELGGVAGGASDIFAKIGDIKGESLDSKLYNNTLGTLSTAPTIIKSPLIK